MNRLVTFCLAALACFIALSCYTGQGQPPVGGRTRGDLRSNVGDERVSRQAEILRLQQMIDRLDSRVQRLERQAVSPAQLPVFTITESQAALQFAELQLAASELAFKNQEVSELQVAAHRMDLARSRTQLEIAHAVHDDRTLALETSLAYAERRLVEETRKQQQLQRMVAKGYSPAEGLELQAIDLEIARKELSRERARMELHKKMAGIADPVNDGEPVNDSDPRDDATSVLPR